VIVFDVLDLALYTLTAIALIVAYILFLSRKNALQELKSTRRYSRRLERSTDQTIAELRAEIHSLARFRDVREVAATAEQLRNAAKALHQSALHKARSIQAAAEEYDAEEAPDEGREAERDAIELSHVGNHQSAPSRNDSPLGVGNHQSAQSRKDSGLAHNTGRNASATPAEQPTSWAASGKAPA
jgi:hypothetical protein